MTHFNKCAGNMHGKSQVVFQLFTFAYIVGGVSKVK